MLLCGKEEDKLRWGQVEYSMTSELSLWNLPRNANLVFKVAGICVSFSVNENSGGRFECVGARTESTHPSRFLFGFLASCGLLSQAPG